MTVRPFLKKLRISFALLLLGSLSVQSAVLPVHALEHHAQDTEQTQKHQNIVHEASCGLCEQYAHSQNTLFSVVSIFVTKLNQFEALEISNQSADTSPAQTFSARAPPSSDLI